jgi:hypothetical protein
LIFVGGVELGDEEELGVVRSLNGGCE